MALTFNWINSVTHFLRFAISTNSFQVNDSLWDTFLGPNNPDRFWKYLRLTVMIRDGLYATEETSRDDAVEFPFHFSSHALLWYAHLAKLLESFPDIQHP